MKRTPLKRTNSTLKKGGPIQRRTTLRKKAPTEEQIQQDRADRDRMWKLFEEHWNMKNGRLGRLCEACQERIYGENKSIYHDHLLPKSVYEKYKYDINNLFLCCAQCHSMKESGNPMPKHKEAIESIKKKYGII